MHGVSVVIPARNAEPFLGEALDSVFGQGLEDPEVVVVDDGSTDRTAEVARRYGRGVRVLSQQAAGSARARNTGLSATGGELIAFLDADDVWEPEKSRLQIPLLRSDPNLALVFSDMVGFGAGSAAPAGYFSQRGFDGRCAPSSIFFYDMISTPTVILRRSCLDQVGRFDESLPIGQDTDLWFRIALSHPFALVDRPLVRRRMHLDNVTRDARLLARCVVEVWGRYLDRCAALEPSRRRRLIQHYARLRWHHLFLEGCSLLKEGRPREARRMLSQAIGLAPLEPRSWAFYVASLLRGTARPAGSTGAGR
ncbi:MAG TPA: glycosyltransferase [Candidatus Polarisedimenticolia bacterium]|nr:glycosyltransferase [Candidatus Polarisedimenticolia bacterium]